MDGGEVDGEIEKDSATKKILNWLDLGGVDIIRLTWNKMTLVVFKNNPAFMFHQHKSVAFHSFSGSVFRRVVFFKSYA